MDEELELESALYTNCLLLGLDPSITGTGANHDTPRVGFFRHSNPKLGEQLLYFILSSFRGPKDFDKVWPIFDSAQSRDFRKVVQGIISELESQGALPRSNSRVSSLATCCGPRFVELLWQLSLHALREVHKRTFTADAASNPLPASLTDVALSHAATLLPVTKARSALERRRFLRNAEVAVHRQAMWSNMAHAMTAEFRVLCAEEAYLQQELEKLHDVRNKVKLEGELWDELVSSSSQNSHMVQRATRLWDSLLSRQNQHEILASGPIEDLIAHLEHRYRISGSALLAAMDQSSVAPPPGIVSSHPDNKDQTGRSQADVNRENHVNNPDSSHTQANDERFCRVDERTARGHPTIDIAEVLRRWTHALQRVHKQSLQLGKVNDGEGPELLRSSHDGGTSGHTESLAATLAEHRQHLASIQVLINRLKEVAPAIQNSITELTEEVNGISSILSPMAKQHARSHSLVQTQNVGKALENRSDEVAEMTSTMSSMHFEKASASSPALKLPPLFSLTPNSSGKGGNMQKRQVSVQTSQIENMREKNSPELPIPNNSMDNPSQANDDTSFVKNLKRSVRKAALSSRSYYPESSLDSRSDDSSEHYFIPVPGVELSHLGSKSNFLRSKKLLASEPDSYFLDNHAPQRHVGIKSEGVPDSIYDLPSLDGYDGIDGFLSTMGSSTSVSDACRSFYDTEEAEDQVFSPPLLMDISLLAESYEDLLDYRMFHSLTNVSCSTFVRN